jgi:hypothetical protein
MWTLTVCAGLFLGICGGVHRYDFQTVEACNQARVQIPQKTIGDGYAVCVPKQLNEVNKGKP